MTGATHLAGQQVHFQIADIELGLHRGRAAPAQQCLDAGQQFRESEGLGQIVVGARLQPADPVVHLAQRAQKQNRRDLLGGPQGLDDGKPIQLGQHPIDDDQVEMAAGGMKQAIAPAAHLIDDITVLRQPLDHIGGCRFIVLDHQNAHAGRVWLAAAIGGGRWL